MKFYVLDNEQDVIMSLAKKGLGPVPFKILGLDVGIDGVIKFNGKVLKHILDPFGYPRVYYVDDGDRIGRYVHRLLAQTYIPNPENKASVNHIDGNKGNYAIKNLEWATPMENTHHAMNFLPKSSHPGRRAVNGERNKGIVEDFKNGVSREDLCVKWNIKRHSINGVLREHA